MAEYIEREALIEKFRKTSKGKTDLMQNILSAVCQTIQKFPAADMVTRTAYDQLRYERDTALAQLKAIGKGIGDKMDDVRIVKYGEWEFPIFADGNMFDPRCKCSECGSIEQPLERHKYCPNCGARMGDGGAGNVLR